MIRYWDRMNYTCTNKPMILIRKYQAIIISCSLAFLLLCSEPCPFFGNSSITYKTTSSSAILFNLYVFFICPCVFLICPSTILSDLSVFLARSPIRENYPPVLLIYPCVSFVPSSTFSELLTSCFLPRLSITPVSSLTICPNTSTTLTPSILL